MRRSPPDSTTASMSAARLRGKNTTMSPFPEVSCDNPGKCTVPPEEGASGLIHAVIVPPAVAARTVPATRVKQMLPALDSTSIGPDTYMMRMPPPPVCARTEPRTSPKSICPPPVRTGGGGIRIMYVSGPMEVESSAGSICLTRVAGTVRAATAGGTITAWINPDAPSSGGTVHLPGLSQLTSGNGDIVVFLPRNLAADIDAVVESGGERRIEADPALALQIQNRGSGPVRAMAALNGGGPPLKLRTTAGKNRFEFFELEIALRQSPVRREQRRG